MEPGFELRSEALALSPEARLLKENEDVGGCNIRCPIACPLHLLSELHIRISVEKRFQPGLLKKEATESLCVSAEVPEGCILAELVARRHFSRKFPLENELRLCL